MNPVFQLAGGSMVGRDHRMVNKNNQDSYVIQSYSDLTVAVVADGCGSGAKTEVGSQLGARLVAEQIARAYGAYRTIDWQKTQRHVLSQLDLLAQNLGGDFRRVVEEYFLFTIVGVVLEPKKATFFACGDGTIYVNGCHLPLGPFAGNMPPYIAYGLLENELKIDVREVRLAPVVELATSDLTSFLIGTDGIDDFVGHEARMMPGIDRLVGPIDQFWTDDRYFRGNPDLVSRQLRLVGRDWPLSNPEHGLLHDDTTLIVGRRIPELQEE